MKIVEGIAGPGGENFNLVRQPVVMLSVYTPSQGFLLRKIGIDHKFSNKIDQLDLPNQDFQEPQTNQEALEELIGKLGIAFDGQYPPVLVARFRTIQFYPQDNKIPYPQFRDTTRYIYGGMVENIPRFEALKREGYAFYSWGEVRKGRERFRRPQLADILAHHKEITEGQLILGSQEMRVTPMRVELSDHLYPDSQRCLKDFPMAA